MKKAAQLSPTPQKATGHRAVGLSSPKKVTKEMPMSTESSQPSGPVTDTRLLNYFRAGYPLLYMVTAEEGRAESEILAAALDKRANRSEVWVWSQTEGLFRADSKTTAASDQNLLDPKNALSKIKSDKRPRAVYIFRDLHQFFSSALIIRHLRDIARDFKQLPSTVIITSPVSKLPPDLQRDAVQIEFELPDRPRVESIFDRMVDRAKDAIKAKNLDVEGDEREKIVSAALGLTTVEAENAFAKGLVEASSGMGSISQRVLYEKAQAVKKTGILEYFPANATMKDVGGLELLKGWLRKRANSFTKAARAYGLPLAKGVLLVGVPGGGKSLSAKAASIEMQVPLIRFDLGRVFGGLVGQSEDNTRMALATIDAIGPCVVWLDEMEKAFAGASGGGSNDSGVTRRVLGTVLTWMQEKETPSFMVATANSIHGIPPEMLRKGRFDEQFFIPEPGIKAREEIVNIHLRKLWKKGTKLEIDVKSLAEVSKGYTGAELEQAIKEAMFTAFDDNGRDITTKDIHKAIKNTNPTTEAFRDQLEEMTKWAKANAAQASIPDDPAEAVGRQIEL